jgi:hypothetical protein
LPIIEIQFLTQLFNAFLLEGHFPAQWKVAQIILILKPRKPANELTFYQQISLLPTASKVCGKLLLERILPLVENNVLTPYGMVSTSNIEILEHFQSKALCLIVDTPWYVPNKIT